MIKRYVAAAVALVFIFILQCTLFKALSLAGISPNILVLYTASIGFMRGKKEGMFIGILAGLLTDLFYCDVFGINVLIFMYVGYINGVFNKHFFPEDVRLPLLLIGASDLIYGGAMFLLRFVFRSKLALGDYFLSIMLPETIYTVLFAIIMFKPVYSVISKFDEIEKRSSKKFV
ncbi:MAG: rod shape-determining protein MreD [Lachnospiraceae bacterium]|nr:rod shape-determining protein MreD [Lachnospiraceae bacterium]